MGTEDIDPAKLAELQVKWERDRAEADRVRDEELRGAHEARYIAYVELTRRVPRARAAMLAFRQEWSMETWKIDHQLEETARAISGRHVGRWLDADREHNEALDALRAEVAAEAP